MTTPDWRDHAAVADGKGRRVVERTHRDSHRVRGTGEGGRAPITRGGDFGSYRPAGLIPGT